MSRFITISSDSKFPDNTFSNFTSLFENPLYLSNDYEVGVTELHYPCDYSYFLGEIKLNFDKSRIVSDSLEHKLVNEQFLYFKQKIENFENMIFDYKESILNNKIINMQNVMEKIQYDFFIHKDTMSTFFYKDLSYIDMTLISDFCLYLQKFDKLLQEVTLLINYTFKDNYNFLIQFENEIKKFSIIIKEYLNNTNQTLRKDFSININDRMTNEQFLEYLEHLFSDFDVVQKNSSTIEVKFDRIITKLEISKNSDFLNKNVKIEKNKLIFKIRKRLELTNCLHITTDIIYDSFSNKPLLRMIKPEGDIGEYIYKSFDRPHYQPVGRTYINTINIKIFDQFQKIVNFNSGPVIIKLHFQKRKK